MVLCLKNRLLHFEYACIAVRPLSGVFQLFALNQNPTICIPKIKMVTLGKRNQLAREIHWEEKQTFRGPLDRSWCAWRKKKKGVKLAMNVESSVGC